jgi:hypothetical protein
VPPAKSNPLARAMVPAAAKYLTRCINVDLLEWYLRADYSWVPRHH